MYHALQHVSRNMRERLCGVCDALVIDSRNRVGLNHSPFIVSLMAVKDLTFKIRLLSTSILGTKYASDFESLSWEIRCTETSTVEYFRTIMAPPCS